MSGNRRSIRLRGYDYTRPAAYFLTLCVKNRECLFGEIAAGVMRLNEYGLIVAEKWRWMQTQFRYVQMDAYVVMPDHFHGILRIIDDHRRGDSRIAPTIVRPMVSNGETKTLGRLVGAFKTVTTKHINIVRNTPGITVWQRNYYERIIRNDGELNRIRGYIENNPGRWTWDAENAENPFGLITPRK